MQSRYNNANNLHNYYNWRYWIGRIFPFKKKWWNMRFGLLLTMLVFIFVYVVLIMPIFPLWLTMNETAITIINIIVGAITLYGISKSIWIFQENNQIDKTEQSQKTPVEKNVKWSYDIERIADRKFFQHTKTDSDWPCEKKNFIQISKI